MSLRALVLLDVVDQHLQPAVDAAMIEVESEAADLERLAAAFVLSGIDAGVELMEHLVVAGEQGLLEDFGVAAVDGRLDRLGGDHYGGLDDLRRLGGGQRDEAEEENGIGA